HSDECAQGHQGVGEADFHDRGVLSGGKQKSCPHACGQLSPVGWIVVGLGVDVKPEERVFWPSEGTV
ncbi:MAG: hypothetical protein WAU10_04740, partial [Caldilineaceae bacterium]